MAEGDSILLGRTPDFRLGATEVSPSACEVRYPGGAARLEPRIMQVLVALAQAEGRVVGRDELIARCWSGRIVGEDVVNRAISLIRKLADHEGQPLYQVETLARIGYRLTPTGAPLTSDGAPPARARRGWRPVPALLLGVLALVAGAVWLPLRSPAQNGRVEVAALEAPAGDAELARLADAIRTSAIRLLANTDVEAASPEAGAAGQDPSAEFQLTGALARQNGDLVLDARVTDRRSGLVLWSERLTRPMAAAQGFEAEAGDRLASFFRCALLDRRAAKRPVEPAVFGQMLRACDAAFYGDHPRMLEITRRLAQEQPELAPAHAMHALAQAAMGLRSDLPATEVAALRAGAQRSAERALALDPNIAKAHLALATRLGEGEHFAERERRLLRALELEPDLLPARAFYGRFLLEVGRLRDAIAFNERLLTADPRATAVRANLALLHAAHGDLPAAERQLDLLEPSAPQLTRPARLWTAVWYGPPEAALRQVRQAPPGSAPKALLDCLSPYLERLAGGTAQGLPAPCAGLPADLRMRLLARQGDIDGAYAAAAALPRTNAAASSLYGPEMRAFRADPRFSALAQRLGLAHYWRTSGHGPDLCNEQDAPPVCVAGKAANDGRR